MSDLSRLNELIGTEYDEDSIIEAMSDKDEKVYVMYPKRYDEETEIYHAYYESCEPYFSDYAIWVKNGIIECIE